MKNIFEHTSGGWLRYPEYEWRKAKDGNFYLLPAPKTVPQFYDPLEVVNDLVLEAVDIGRRLIQHAPEKQCREQIKAFANKYGLLGIMTALPTTADFFKYEKVYLPRNSILREETMDTYAYLELFFPFRMSDAGQFLQKLLKNFFHISPQLHIGGSIFIDFCMVDIDVDDFFAFFVFCGVSGRPVGKTDAQSDDEVTFAEHFS